MIKLSNDKVPYFTQYYTNDKDPLVCESKVKNHDENTCTRCHKVYDDKEIEEWFCCPLS